MQESLDRELAARQRFRQQRAELDNGHLTVKVGPVDSGKSPWLVGQFWSMFDQGIKVQFFIWGRHSLKTTLKELGWRKHRYPRDVEYPPMTQVAPTAADLYLLVRRETRAIFVDDFQRFDEDIATALEMLASPTCEVQVSAAARELDDEGIPVPHVARLLAVADRAEKLSALCPECYRSPRPTMTPGTRTLYTGGSEQIDSRISPRLADRRSSEEARCRYHYSRHQANKKHEHFEFRGPISPQLTVITGCMWAGKTRRLIYELGRCPEREVKVQAFKHVLDVRRFPAHASELWSHTRHSYPAQTASTSDEIARLLNRDTQVIGIDEAHFFDEGIVPLVEDLANRGKWVIVAGLDMNFRAQPFGPMPELMALADDLDKRPALCRRCKTQQPTATRTQRLIDENPAPWDHPEILPVDSKDNVRHTPRCRHHHEIDGAPPLVLGAPLADQGAATG